MHKISKKFISVIVSTCILASVSSLNYAESTKSDEAAISDKVQKMELEINKLEDKEMSDAAVYLKSNKIPKTEKEKIKDQRDIKIKEGTQKILSKYGFEPVASDDILQPMSSSTSLVITDALTYDFYSGLYRFQGDWDFDDSSWDSYVDMEDFAGVRMTNITGYSIYSSFAKTWDEVGTQTGYVDNYGQHTGQNLTKRFEDSAGVCYNVIDQYFYTTDYGAGYQTDKGRITQYISRGSGGSCKVFLDYNHNYKTWALGTSASLSSINFGGPSFALNVTYSQVGGSWQRCSGGRIIQ